MKLRYTHWRAGNVEVEVTPMKHDTRYYKARTKVYFVDSAHKVYSAGGVGPDGDYQPRAHIHVGWDAKLEVTPIAGTAA